MKNLLIVTLILFSVNLGFAQETMTRKEKKAAKKAEQIEKIKAMIDANAWQFDARQMLPTAGKSRSLTTSYNIVVQDNQLDSYLPYFGRAYNADYGSTESPMTFKSEISEFKKEDWKKGGWIIKFKALNKNDNMDFTLYVSDSGSASLSIISTNRQPISFQGDLVEIENKKK